MNIELSPEINRTCSKGHGKIANNNSSQTWQKITGHDRSNITLQCLELANNKLQQAIMANLSLACFYSNHRTKDPY